MRRAFNLAFRGIVVTSVALGSLAMVSTEVSAYNLIGCKYNTAGNSLRWTDTTSRNEYSNPAQWAISRWNSTSTQFNFAAVSSGANLRLADGNFGNTGFDGILLDASGVNPTSDNPLLKCRNGYWAETNTAWLNRYYTDSYSGAKKQSVYVHEVGHALGLAHRSSCVIMHPTTSVRYDECGRSTPAQDDINGANALY
ncbi:matrixin family metalloprotease [Streptomyces sp. PTY087I2]|uniref:matrixin family metalloprotease n=1 Tax=Streptomyces sp. PTY087I2 TaxID=1819298 RepID=UPI0008284AE7|nr:matrixin family metalloprotease [Streptomyces sp. PTY087I2]OCC09512.1 Matrixin [Streptomyces sp. PTY087I2]